MHALLGPSSSDRWIACPGSARATEHMPDDYSAYADEGTLAHEISEKFLLRAIGDISPQKLAGYMRSTRKKDWYTPEMEDHCKAYVDYVMGIGGDMVMVEQKLDLSQYFPESFGTGDALVVDDQALHVIDLKYGKGVVVQAEGNTQLKCYALGALLLLNAIFDINKVVVHIFQPRLIDGLTYTEYTPEELIAWAEEVAPQARKAFDGVGEFKSGKHCRWCKLAPTCQIRADETVRDVFETMIDDPADLKELKVAQMSDAEITYWLPHITTISNWLKDLKKHAEKEALAGHHFEGWKLVEGKSNRCYFNEDQIIETLKGADVKGYMTEPKLLGITAMKEVLGKSQFDKLLSPFLIKPPGKPTIVPETDKRPPIDSAKDVFKD